MRSSVSTTSMTAASAVPPSRSVPAYAGDRPHHSPEHSRRDDGPCALSSPISGGVLPGQMLSQCEPECHRRVDVGPGMVTAPAAPKTRANVPNSSARARLVRPLVNALA